MGTILDNIIAGSETIVARIAKYDTSRANEDQSEDAESLKTFVLLTVKTLEVNYHKMIIQVRVLFLNKITPSNCCHFRPLHNISFV